MRFAQWPSTASVAVMASFLLASANIAADASAEPVRTVQGSVDGWHEGEPVWVGVFGDAPEAVSWTQAHTGRFEVELPPGERATLLLVSKNRVACALPASGGSPTAVAWRLSPGLTLAGTVRAEDGVPFRDAEITVEAAKGHGLAVPLHIAPRWRSDGRGEFQVHGLRPGRHVVKVMAEGHIPVTLEHVQVREGAENRVEAELLTAHFVTGRVVDGDGRPVAGVDVEADGWFSAITSQTKADGAYRLGPFRWRERMTVSAGSPGLGSTVRHDGVAAPREGLMLVIRRHAVAGRLVDATTGAPVPKFRLTVSGREAWEHDVEADDGAFRVPLALHRRADSIIVQATGYLPWFKRLTPPAGGRAGGGDREEHNVGEIALVPGRSLSGRVVDVHTSEPIRGARVSRDVAKHPYGTWRMWLERGAVAAGDGAFTLDGLPVEAVPIEIRAEGYETKNVRLSPTVSHLDFALRPVAPRPVVAITGSIVLADGTPTPGIVGLQPAADPASADVEVSSKQRFSGNAHDIANAYENGEFRFERSFPDGVYLLEAISDGGVVTPRTVVIRNGQSVEDVQLVVKEDRQLRISLAGLLASEIEAGVTVHDKEGRLAYNWWWQRNGTYRVFGIPEEAVVTATVNGGWETRSLVRRIRLGDGGEAVAHFDFTPDARLGGTVTVGERPLARMKLRVLPANPSAPKAHVDTNHQGRYEVYGLAEGMHTVRAGAHSFEVQVGRDTPFDIELPAVSLAGVVSYARTGQPVWAADVRLQGNDGFSDRARTEPDGTFRFEGLAAGEHVVSVSEPGFERLAQPLLIVGDEVVELHLAEAESGFDPMQERHDDPE